MTSTDLMLSLDSWSSYARYAVKQVLCRACLLQHTACHGRYAGTVLQPGLGQVTLHHHLIQQLRVGLQLKRQRFARLAFLI